MKYIVIFFEWVNVEKLLMKLIEFQEVIFGNSN